MIQKSKVIVLASALSLLTASMIGQSATAEPRRVSLDRVVAVVGSSSVLYSDVVAEADNIIAQRRERGYTLDRDPRSEALERLMLQKLLFNQALLDSVEISKGEVAQGVENRINDMIENEGSIAAVEAKNHRPIFELREEMRQRFEEQSYAAAMQNQIVSKVTITPNEVERYFKSMDNDSLPEIGEQYIYAHIVRYPKSIASAKQRTKGRLLEMRERIISGKARFETLARMYSVDPGTVMRGGEMEPTTLQSIVQPFAEALSKLKPGQVSEVVETQFGFHIIELIDKKGSSYHCRHILLKPVYTREELFEPLSMLDSLSKQIKAGSISFEDAAKRYSDDDYSKMNGGVVTNHELLERYQVYNAKYTQTRFLKEDFGEMGSGIADYKMLSAMKVGDVSTAYQTTDGMGNEMSKIVKLVDVIPAHMASIDEDYIRLEEMALAEKQNKYFDQWIAKRIKSMYIYIDPEFRGGEFNNKSWLK